MTSISSCSLEKSVFGERSGNDYTDSITEKRMRYLKQVPATESSLSSDRQWQNIQLRYHFRQRIPDEKTHFGLSIGLSWILSSCYQRHPIRDKAHPHVEYCASSEHRLVTPISENPAELHNTITANTKFRGQTGSKPQR